MLKLALVVVGLDRAPKNMMHPRLANSELVRALGGHHDNVVVQYTVWAVTENPSLRLGDLGVDIKLVEDQPANVRSWIFRLIAMTPEDAERNYEYVELGSRDLSAEARAGLAVGLKDTYFDGLEALVLDWFIAEADGEVRQLLMDHIVRQAPNCPSYEGMALEIYEKEPAGSTLRKRMEATAAGSAMYAKLKRSTVTGDLFELGGVNMTQNIVNITGGMHGGAVSAGGDAVNSNQTIVHYNSQTNEAIQSELSKLEAQVHNSQLDGNLKAELIQQISTAKTDPAPEKLNNLIARVKTAGEVVLAGTTIWEIAHVLAKLAGLA